MKLLPFLSLFAFLATTSVHAVAADTPDAPPADKPAAVDGSPAAPEKKKTEAPAAAPAPAVAAKPAAPAPTPPPAAVVKPAPAKPVAATPAVAAKSAPAPAVKVKPAAASVVVAKPAPVAVVSKSAPGAAAAIVAAPVVKPVPAKVTAKPVIVAAPTVATNPKLNAPPKDGKVPEMAKPADPWRVTAGPQWREIGSLHFHSASQTSGGALPSSGNSGVAAIGSATAVGNRTYADGYVKLDVGGGATTWNFGYQNASQVNGATLNYHASGTEISAQTLGHSVESGWNDDAFGIGGFVTFQSPELYHYKGFSFSGDAGYSLTRGQSIHTGIAAEGVARSDIRSVTITDSYDTTGVLLPIAPYAGTFNGPGPVISNIPASRATTVTGEVAREAAFMAVMRNRLTTDLHTFSFGGDAHLNISKFRLGIGTGFALNVTNWEAASREDLVVGGKSLGALTSSRNGTDVLPGWYLEVNASLPLTEHVSLFASGRYDWAGSLHGSTGAPGSSFDLDMGGWTLAAGITYTF